MNSALRKTRLFITLLFVLGGVTALSAQPVNNIASSRKDSLQNDLSLLRNRLRQQYPSLYRYTAKAQMDHLFDSCAAAIKNNTTHMAFLRTVKFLLSAMKDGHLSCSPSPTLRQQLKEHTAFIPFRLRFINNKAYIQHAVNASLPAGTEITVINHRSINSIKNELFRYLVSDGDVASRKRYVLGNFFYFYYFLVFGEQPHFEITYRSLNGSTGTTTVEAVPEKEIPAPIAGIATEKLLNITVTSDSIAMITIRTFDRDELKAANLDFEAFLQTAFTSIQEKQIKKLLIDLRDNGGGRDLYGSLLYAYLTRSPFHYYKRLTAATEQLPFDQFTRASSSYNDLTPGMLLKTGPQTYQLKTEAHANLGVLQPANYHYTHSVWFLINGLSFSTTVEFCAIAYNHRRGKFIGEESGGAYAGNTSGSQSTLVLPNTQIIVSFGLIQYELAVNNNKHSSCGIIPDHEMQPAIKDLLAGNDTQLAYALELVRHAK